MATPPDLVRLDTRLAAADYVRAIWARREFAAAIPLGDLKTQNMDTVLGGLWHLLNPLLLVVVYYLVFGVLLRVGDRGTENFVAFLTLGVFTFAYTRKSVQSGAKALISNVSLIRTIRFPRAILPLAAVGSETIALGPAILVMLSVVLLTGEPVRPAWLVLPFAYALQAAFNLGAALIVARLTDHFRDVQQLLPYFLQIWFYLSGVLYSAKHWVTDQTYELLFRLNPAYCFVTIVRQAVLDGVVDPGLWSIAAAWSAVMLAVGFWYFRAHEQEYGRG